MTQLALFDAKSTTRTATSALMLLRVGVLSELDYALAQALLGLTAESNAELELGVALASWAVQRGNVCADLQQICDVGFHDEEGHAVAGVVLPQLAHWLSCLQRSQLVQTDLGSGQVSRPLVLQGTRLYLARYFAYEQRLAQALLERSQIVHSDLDAGLLKKTLDSLFPPAQAGAEGQRHAALFSALGGLSVISGGPGTGKTYSVAKILILLQQLATARGEPCEIQLLAPTGKAAQRLGDALTQNLRDVPEELRKGIPTTASTVHRALGYQHRMPTRFRHGKDNPLSAQVVVVDETSMVDLALMSKLVEAVHPRARLILLGDKDQLASVEAGAIFGDIFDGNPGDGYSAPRVEAVRAMSGDALPVSRKKPTPGLHDSMVHLTRVHRFEGKGPIAELARAINAGNAEAALALLSSSAAKVSFRETKPDDSLEIFRPLVTEHFSNLGQASANEKLQMSSAFRFLCAHKRGPFGVEAVNAFVETELVRQGSISDLAGGWYEGRPILITENDYSLDLWNGDVGVLARDEGGVGLVAVFPAADAGPRRFAPALLPAHETVFAMSVHKAQGSELDEIALVLPPLASPVVTRELIYTAVTRAKSKVTIFGSKDVLAQAIETRVARASGLAQLLWS